MKKKSVLFIIIPLILLLLAIGRLLFLKFKNTTIETTSKILIEEVVKQGSNGSLSEEQMSEITNSIQEEDKEIVENIIENHLDGETIQKAMEYMKNNDIDGLKKFANEELTDEEKKELIDIYLQYKEQIDNVINNTQESSSEDINVDYSQDAKQDNEEKVEKEKEEEIFQEENNENNKNEDIDVNENNENQYKTTLDILNSMSQEEIQNLIQKYNNMSDSEKESVAKQYGVTKQEIDALVALYSTM